MALDLAKGCKIAPLKLQIIRARTDASPIDNSFKRELLKTFVADKRKLFAKSNKEAWVLL